MGTPAPQTPGTPGDQGGEQHHRQDGPSREGQQIGDRSRGRREGQSWQDTQEMGAPGKAMEGANAEGRVRMTLCRSIMLPVGTGMNMQVGVGLAVVRVMMGMDMEVGGLTKTPDPNPDQHRAHKTFTPSRDRLDGQRFPETEGRQADQRHACGVTQTPAQADPPTFPMGTCHQRRHSRQMVRSGPDVEEPRAQTEDRNPPRLENEARPNAGQSPAS